jgi:hypothetical protein
MYPTTTTTTHRSNNNMTQEFQVAADVIQQTEGTVGATLRTTDASIKKMVLDSGKRLIKVGAKWIQDESNLYRLTLKIMASGTFIMQMAIIVMAIGLPEGDVFTAWGLRLSTISCVLAWLLVKWWRMDYLSHWRCLLAIVSTFVFGAFVLGVAIDFSVATNGNNDMFVGLDATSSRIVIVIIILAWLQFIMILFNFILQILLGIYNWVHFVSIKKPTNAANNL